MSNSSQDFNMFEALNAADRKDYGYWDRLTVEQQKKFVPYLMVLWMVCVRARGSLQDYYLRSVDYHANQHLFNESVQHHPQLQWLMLCASSPGVGIQKRQWIPQLSQRENLKFKDFVDYYRKVYNNIDEESIKEIATAHLDEHRKKCYIAKQYPTLKPEDISLLAQLVDSTDIEKYDKELGN